MRRVLTLLCFVLLNLLTTKHANAGDPYLRWYTVKTPHFHVHYHSGLEQFAQRVANGAESGMFIHFGVYVCYLAANEGVAAGIVPSCHFSLLHGLLTR